MQRHPLVTQLEQDYADKIVQLKFLKRGDNGSVSRADFLSGKRICIKSIPLKNTTARKDAENTRIMYANVFPVHQYQDQHLLYFTMPFFAGCTLEDIINKRPACSLIRLRIFLQLVNAVKEMHSRGILHRDLKPANVMVDMLSKGLEVNIIDFGRSVCLFHPRTGKNSVSMEDLSLRNTVAHTHSIFYPVWQFVRKWQRQTAPEYTSLTSHFSGYPLEAESVGFRSDYYSLATLFQTLLPEYAALAAPVITSSAFDRNHAYHVFIKEVLDRYRTNNPFLLQQAEGKSVGASMQLSLTP